MLSAGLGYHGSMLVVAGSQHIKLIDTLEEETRELTFASASVVFQKSTLSQILLILNISSNRIGIFDYSSSYIEDPIYEKFLREVDHGFGSAFVARVAIEAFEETAYLMCSHEINGNGSVFFDKFNSDNDNYVSFEEGSWA